MIIPYVLSEGSPVQIVNLGQTAPLGGISFNRVVLLATAAMNGHDLDDPERQAVVDSMAADFGVYLAMMPDAPAGQVIDLAVQATATGKANEYQIGSVRVGYTYLAEPAEATKAQHLDANVTIAANKATEARTTALEAFGSAQYAIQSAAGRTPRAASDWISDGLDWYDDPGSVSTDIADVLADAQAKGLIP